MWKITSILRGSSAAWYHNFNLIGVSLTKPIERLWPGGLPTFNTTDEVNRLLQALMSLWNHLARHQKPSKPFRFTQSGKPADQEDLSSLVAMRCREIDSFLEGLFDDEEELEVSEEIADELDVLEEIYRLLSKVGDRLTKGADGDWQTERLDFPRHVRDLSLMAEAQVNKVIQACVAWRRVSPASPNVKRRTHH